ncbi:hypothetical protein [Spirillospora sp. CA-294931]|uniref:hypothetical protein n=1 Tax=Spirillospora sp. CA-294931 TaxID=3240042 RepID=UPI003D933F25
MPPQKVTGSERTARRQEVGLRDPGPLVVVGGSSPPKTTPLTSRRPEPGALPNAA